MDWEALAPVIMTVVVTVTVGAVVLLKPLTRRLGDILELMVRQQGARAGEVERELRRMSDVMEGLGARLTSVEERQDFAERLLSAPGDGRRVTACGSAGDPGDEPG